MAHSVTRVSRNQSAIGYLTGIVVVAMATIAIRQLGPIYGHAIPVAAMSLAVIAVGWFGGLWPAIFTTTLGVVALTTSVNFAQWPASPDTTPTLVLFVLLALAISAVCGAFRRATLRAEERTNEIVRTLEEKLLAERNLTRTTKQLERSDTFHRLITELTSDFTFRFAFPSSSEPRLEYISPGCQTMVGVTMEQLTQDGKWLSHVHPHDRHSVLRTFVRARKGLSDRNEIAIVNAQGEWIWLRYITQPLIQAGGKVNGMIGAAQSITEQKRLERCRESLLSELADKTCFIESVLGQIPIGIVVADASTGRIINANFEAERINGFRVPKDQEVTSIICENQLRGVRGNGSVIAPGEWPLQRALRGERVQDEKITLYRGDQPPVMLGVNAGPVVDRDGKVIAAVSAYFDESLRRHHEDQVRESQRFLRCSLDALSSHIAVLDEHGFILEVNQAWRNFADLNGLATENYGIGSNYISTFEVNDATCGRDSQIANGIREVIHGTSNCFEFEYPCHSEQEQRWFLMRVTRFNQPGPTRVVVAHEDVTKLRQAVDALRDADRRKDEFLATLAHELRNPLAPIRNALGVLRLQQIDDLDLKECLEMVERQTVQLTRLVDDLLDVSRVMRGKIELRLRSVSLNDVIQHAVETAQPLIDAKRLQLKRAPIPDAQLVFGDPIRLTQVISNLLTNAAKYTEPEGEISVDISREEEWLTIQVRDSGIGIASEALQSIFELFVQVDHATTRSQGGLGIGLTLVKNLVELHGGAVTASSKGLGYGSTFTVKLPQRIQEPAPAKSKSPHKPTVSPCRILVVDDNIDAARSMAILLRTLGHQVHVANSGENALCALSTCNPQVIFLDLGMPDMDGYEVAQAIRSSAAHHSICLAALTGWGQAEDRRRTLEAGFNHHIVKPAELNQIQEILASVSSTTTSP